MHCTLCTYVYYWTVKTMHKTYLILHLLGDISSPATSSGV